MKYQDFIISKTVSDHLQSIGYQPSALEAAWLVWQCKNATLKQKHDAWREIIATTEDCSIPAGDWRGTSRSLHEYLRKHMDTEQKELDAFYENESGRAVYTYALCYEYEDFEWNDDDCLFSDFDICWQAVREDFDLGVKAVRVQKRLLNEATGSVWVDFLPDRQVVAVSTENDAAFADALIDEWFEGLHLPIPTPFKQGDALLPAKRRMGPRSSFEDECLFDGVENGIPYACFESADGERVREMLIHPLNYEIYVSDRDNLQGGKNR